MTTFSRLIKSPVHAFQFKEIELDESLKDSDLSVRIHHQLDEQFSAFKAAGIPLNIGTFEFAAGAETDPSDLTLVITASAPGHSRFAVHVLKFGDWLVYEPVMLDPWGCKFSDEDFKAEYGADIPATDAEIAVETEESVPKRVFRASSYDRGVQIAAAGARVAIDKKLGEKTPDWIVELSKESK